MGRFSVLATVVSVAAALACAQPGTSAPTSFPATSPADSLPRGAIRKLSLTDADGKPVGEVAALAYRDESKTLYAACDDGRLHVIPIEGGKTRTLIYPNWRAVPPEPAPASSPASQPGSPSGVRSDESFPKPPPGDPRRLRTLTLSRDGKLLAATDKDGVHLWQLPAEKYLGKFEAREPAKPIIDDEAQRLSVDAGKQTIAFRPTDLAVTGTVPRRDFVSPVLSRYTVLPKLLTLGEDYDAIGEYKAVLWAIYGPANPHPGTRVWLFETDTGRVADDTPIFDASLVSGCMAMAPSGRFVAVGAQDGQLLIYDLEKTAKIKGHASAVTAVAFSRDGASLFSADGDGTVFVWNVAQCRPAVAKAKRNFKQTWSLLADLGDEAHVVLRAIWHLAEAGDDAIEPLLDRVHPRDDMDKNEFTKLLEDLDNDTFAIRKTAREKLESVAQHIWPLLVKASTDKTYSSEVRNAMEETLTRVDRANPAQERAAIKILERIDSDLARQTLRTLAALPADGNLGKNARLALARLRLSASSQPAISTP